MNDIVLTDFPKVHCPFVRKAFPIEQSDFKTYGKEFNLRKPEVYLVMNEVTPGYDWVFDDDTFAVEKLDGSNTKIVTKDNVLIALQNRKNVLNPLALSGNTFYAEGVFNAARRNGYVSPNGEQAGELIGPKFQGNPYKMEEHLWYPFEKAVRSLRYKSFNTHDKNIVNWSSWLHRHIFSLFASLFNFYF